MEKYFSEFNEDEFKDAMDKIFKEFDYKKDNLYRKELDVKCSLKIKKEDLGKEKELINRINRKKKKIKINIPKNLENGQSIIVINEGKKKNDKYGNLVVKIKIV